MDSLSEGILALQLMLLSIESTLFLLFLEGQTCRERIRQRGMKGEVNLPSAGLFPRWPLKPGLGQP